jgi:CHASE2 domain-containing sensor protein
MNDSAITIFKYILTGLLIIAALAGIKILIESTYWGHRVELFTFELLQGQLSPFNPKKELPVVVVDISELPLKNDKYKDREKLIELVTAIAEQQPLAIGVDIILSPDKDGVWKTQFDEDFLVRCLEISKNKGIPVFLGVDSDMPLGNPGGWLGSKDFKELASTIAIYRNRKDTARFLLWAKSKNQTEKLPSMSLALAQVERKRNPERIQPPPQWLHWAIETDEEFPGKKQAEDDVEYVDALLNYSKLEAVQQTNLLNSSAISVKEFSRKFKGRIVILGNGALGASDSVITPIHEEPVPGVYIHACALYTLIREPMYEFKSWFRVLIDTALPLIVLIVVAAFRVRHRSDKTPYDWHKLQRRIVWLGGCGIFAAAILLVNAVGVLWLDFLFIAAGLLLHPWVEKKLAVFWHRIRKAQNQKTA